MDYSKDRKDKHPPAISNGESAAHLDNALETERTTFGQQQPYANMSTSPAPTRTLSVPSTPQDTSTPDQFPTAPRQPQQPSEPLPGQGQYGRGPTGQDWTYPEDSQRSSAPQGEMAPPPAYEEVVGPRAPHSAYGPSNGANYGPNASTPLLSPGSNAPNSSTPLLSPGSNGPNANNASTYTSIPVPPPRPPSSLSGSTESNPEQARRFNRLWILFFITAFILSIADYRDDEGSDHCSGRRSARRVLGNLDVGDNIQDFVVNIADLEGLVLVERARADDISNPGGVTRVMIEAVGSDREFMNAIQHDISQDSKRVKVSASRFSDIGENACLQLKVKILFPYHRTQVREMKLILTEGNVTVNLLDEFMGGALSPGPPAFPILPFQIKTMYSRVITGHTHVRAEVSNQATIGASVGSIQGHVLVGKELRVQVVEGNVDLAISQKNIANKMDSRVETVSGNIEVAMKTHYNGLFRLETVQGKLDVLNRDPANTVLSTFEPTEIRGWNTSQGKEPYYTSEVRLQTHSGNIDFSLKPNGQ
ncbi:hypothetical protein BGW38_008507 [Lunasporangiospora selenospora]|uniref:Adhesin domain-containing protein n=1 Tax=Lunasporangiospora selenospora TaxID=979761 RepID=A0A9P6FXZ3_9FUNG|nr:hypothetical protein BGW38_008507 [Lunasporangiospora selenospora]